MPQTENISTAQLISVEDAIDFLKSRGFQINPVDGIYRVRKEGWERRPYEIDAETLIEQANLFRNMAEKAKGQRRCST